MLKKKQKDFYKGFGIKKYTIKKIIMPIAATTRQKAISTGSISPSRL